MSFLLACPRTIAAPFRVGSRAVHHDINRARRPPLRDGDFHSEPVYPNLNLTRRGSPQCLDQLRPPQEEYVAKPVPDSKSSISVSLFRKINYWYRLSKSLHHFYKEGLRKAWYNKREANQIRARVPSPGDSALFGGCQVASGISIPTITRREYQLLLRANSDFVKLLPVGFIVYGFGILAPSIIRLLPRSLLPGTCLREKDQVKVFKAWQARFARFSTERLAFFLPAPGRRDYFLSLLFWHAYVVSSHPLSFLHPFVPSKLRVDVTHPSSYFLLYFPRARSEWLWTYPLFSWIRRHLNIYHSRNLYDTALIMREGGFAKLDPLDVYEYCIMTGNEEFYEYCSQDALRRQELPSSPALVKRMAPNLDLYAKYLLSNRDWSRLKQERRFFVEALSRVWDHRLPGGL